MNAKRVERIVVAEPALDFVAEEPGNQAGSNPDNDAARGVNETACRGDDDQPRDCSRTKTEHTWLAPDHPLSHRPDEGGDCRGNGRSGKGIGSDPIRSDRAS